MRRQPMAGREPARSDRQHGAHDRDRQQKRTQPFSDKRAVIPEWADKRALVSVERGDAAPFPGVGEAARRIERNDLAMDDAVESGSRFGAELEFMAEARGKIVGVFGTSDWKSRDWPFWREVDEAGRELARSAKMSGMPCFYHVAQVN